MEQRRIDKRIVNSDDIFLSQRAVQAYAVSFSDVYCCHIDEINKPVGKIQNTCTVCACILVFSVSLYPILMIFFWLGTIGHLDT